MEMAGTLADLLPNWYAGLGGNEQEVRVVLLNHGNQILEGDINSRLRETAQQGQGTYLEMLPAPIHDLKVTGEWLNDEIFKKYLEPVSTGDVVKVVGGALVGAIVARKLLQVVTEGDRHHRP